MEEQEFKQAALTAGMLNLKAEFDNRFQKVVKDWQDAVEALLLNVDETSRAKNERSFFEKALDQIDNGYGAVGEKIKFESKEAGYDGGKIDMKLPDEAFLWDKNNLQKTFEHFQPHDNIGGHEVVKPMERWKPEKGETYWFVSETGSTNSITNSMLWDGGHVDKAYYDFGNVFPSEQEAIAARDRVKKALLG